MPELGLLDISVEALVCSDPWTSLFDDEEIAEAKSRLKQLNFDID